MGVGVPWCCIRMEEIDLRLEVPIPYKAEHDAH